MMKSKRDIWCEWLLQRRFGGDIERMKAAMEYLYRVRDKLFEHVSLRDGETVLDIGCGDGFIGFGVLERLNEGKVIFIDISQDLLDHVQSIAQEKGVVDRCRFIRTPAEDLSPIADNSVDVVMTRSVLIYVKAKQQAFREFYRVLKAEGRLSIFEPINSFGFPEPPNIFWGYEVAPVAELAGKVKALYQRLQPLESDPMLDFYERDLVAFAEQAGFGEIHLELQIEIKPKEKLNWATMLRTAGNPKMPTLEEAMQEALSPAEREKFVSHLRPLVEAGRGGSRSAVAYLWAMK